MARAKPVKVRDELDLLTPRLRRYARALATGNPAPSEPADDLVHATLMRALGARVTGHDLAIRLFATLTQLHRDRAATVAAASQTRPALVKGTAGVPVRRSKLCAGLLRLPLEAREALLLVTLEGFEHGDAARILRVSRSVLVRRLTHARSALDGFMQGPLGGRAVARDVPHLRLVR